MLESLKIRNALDEALNSTGSVTSWKTTAAENNITKTALMIIGDAVGAAHYERSKLYDPAFTTEFREATE